MGSDVPCFLRKLNISVFSKGSRRGRHNAPRAFDGKALEFYPFILQPANILVYLLSARYGQGPQEFKEKVAARVLTGHLQFRKICKHRANATAQKGVSLSWRLKTGDLCPKRRSEGFRQKGGLDGKNQYHERDWWAGRWVEIGRPQGLGGCCTRARPLKAG